MLIGEAQTVAGAYTNQSSSLTRFEEVVEEEPSAALLTHPLPRQIEREFWDFSARKCVRGAEYNVQTISTIRRAGC